jgi:hypothetical protein
MTRIAVIAGAGYSRAGGWPDTSAILDHGAWAMTAGKAARYQAVRDAYDAWKATAPNPSGDVFMAEVVGGRVRGVTWEMVVEVVQGTLASPGVNPRAAYSPRYGDSLMQPSRVPSHAAFFTEVLAAGDLSGVVSLNYDLLVEKVLQPAPLPRSAMPGFHYGGLPHPQVCTGRASSPFPRDRAREPLELVGAVPVWKPHGSLNWHRQWADWDRTSARITIYPDLRAAFRGTGEAAIIPPVMVEDSVPPWLAGIWARAAALLGSVEEWWVAGYSLPDADVALREMLRAAADAGTLRRIYVRNLSDRTRARWKAIAGGVLVEFGPPL